MLNSSGVFVFHRPKQKKHALIPRARVRALSHFSQLRTHTAYQCPVYYWLTSGTVITEHNQSQSCYCLYSEYRDANKMARYHSRSFASLNEALAWLNQQADHSELPFICPETTRVQPVYGGDSVDMIPQKQHLPTPSQMHPR